MRPLKDLNLLDRFLFAEAMEDPENMRDILEIILGKDVVLKHLPQTRKGDTYITSISLCQTGCMGGRYG